MTYQHTDFCDINDMLAHWATQQPNATALPCWT
jgi:hypothetical protein